MFMLDVTLLGTVGIVVIVIVNAIVIIVVVAIVAIVVFVIVVVSTVVSVLVVFIAVVIVQVYRFTCRRCCLPILSRLPLARKRFIPETKTTSTRSFCYRRSYGHRMSMSFSSSNASIVTVIDVSSAIGFVVAIVIHLLPPMYFT